jgi:hypothetical protein
MISEFTESIKNENLIFHCIPHSSHMPSRTAMDYILKDGLDFLAENR